MKINNLNSSQCYYPLNHDSAPQNQSRYQNLNESNSQQNQSSLNTPNWKEKFLSAFKKAANIGKGLRALERAGFSGKTIEEDHWAETFFEDHLYNHKSLILKWKKDSTHLSYEEWSRGKIPESEKSQVKYCSKKERAEYLVSFTKDTNGNTILTRNNTPYDTAQERTDFSGNGVAIFVVGSDLQLYCGSHTYSKFHHSSFMSGTAVLCAGEIIINNGKIEAFTNKTGHYQSKQKESINLIQFLKLQDLDLSKIIYEENNKTYTAQYFLDSFSIFSESYEDAKMSM